MLLLNCLMENEKPISELPYNVRVGEIQSLLLWRLLPLADSLLYTDILLEFIFLILMKFCYNCFLEEEAEASIRLLCKVWKVITRRADI